MPNFYTTLLSETRAKIKEIRRESFDRITETQNQALLQVEQDFISLGWNKYWTSEQLIEDGQFERLEQSITDTDLDIIEIDEKSGSGKIEGNSRLYRVSGERCSCTDFIYRGLPCKHMFFLAGVLVGLHNQEISGELS
ncbi:MAG: SWIM zinc finger family protein [Ruminococcaceae bacterium]|nr:SWIM zinc finger family protein [Oscillospiraceae bacterium]